ncbi:MAG: hypothetical protein AAF092_10545 [Pseudomonadota bacterium]
MGLFSSSRSSSTTINETSDERMITEAGGLSVNSGGGEVILTDHGALQVAGDASEEAFRSAVAITERGNEIAGDAVMAAILAQEAATAQVAQAYEAAGTLQVSGEERILRFGIVALVVAGGVALVTGRAKLWA